jgi:glucan phosphoethanolaminetransferase (alkaline phosphatase superfamily)
MTPFEKATLILALFAAWGVIFFGVWAVSILSNSSKILVDIVWSIAFSIAIVGFAYWNRLNPVLRQTALRFRNMDFEPIAFWLIIIIAIFEGIGAWWIALFNWKVFEVSGTPVLTYSNLFSIIVMFGGGYLLLFVWRRIRQREIVKKRKKRKDRVLIPK